MYLTPMAFWCWSCFALGRGLVNGSATFRSVCTLQIFMSPSWTYSRIKWKRSLICFIFLCDLGSCALAMARVLSQYIANGSNALGTTPSSVMNSFPQIASCAASEAAKNYDSVEDFDMLLCLALLQLIVAPFKINTYPDCDFE